MSDKYQKVMGDQYQRFFKAYRAAKKVHKQHEAVLKLINQGYRRTSNRHCLVSRVDRPDWRDVMAQDHAPWDWTGQGRSWVNNLGAGASDFYRRCLSKDTIKVDPEVSRLMPTSGWDTCGYINKRR